MLSEHLKDELRDAFGEQFMQPEIEEADYFEVETNEGTEFVSADVVRTSFKVNFKAEGVFDTEHDLWATLSERLRPYVAGRDIGDISPKHGFLARLSAPGYMDCTDWAAFDTADEAAQYLLETYGDE